jgi:hypothetical protein
MSSSLPLENRRLTRRHFLRAGVRVGTLGAALSLGGTGYAAAIEPDWVEIEQVELILKRLPRAFDGFRLAQISDVHIEGGDMARRFPSVCDLVSAQGADAIVMTGDYSAYGGTWQGESLFQGFRRLKAASGVFAVMGNHDHRRSGDADPQTGPDVVRGAFERAGVTELPNRAVRLQRGADVLWMAGIDDAMTGHADFLSLATQIPFGNAAILLHHEPDFADDFAPSRLIDLMLCGHSHGGQIAMPFFGPIHLPPYSQKYPRGLYQVGEMALYTNRGLGTVSFPVRFCARPEITVFTLKCA